MYKANSGTGTVHVKRAHLLFQNLSVQIKRFPIEYDMHILDQIWGVIIIPS